MVYGTGIKIQVTVLACVNAAGYAIPPLVFKCKNLVKPLMEGEAKGTMYGLSPSGWMDGEIFCDCLERYFLLYAPASRPLLLLLDGHSSHYMADVVRTAASKGVILFCLPPNTIHATQPLEEMCFHALKKHWDDVINAYMTANPGKFVTVYQFNKVFHDAWDKAMIPSTIHSGFKPTGVYPATFLANIHQKERVFQLKMLLNQVVSAISLCIVLMCLKGGCHLHHLLNCCHHFHFHLSLQYHQRYLTLHLLLKRSSIFRLNMRKVSTSPQTADTISGCKRTTMKPYQSDVNCNFHL